MTDLPNSRCARLSLFEIDIPYHLQSCSYKRWNPFIQNIVYCNYNAFIMIIQYPI
ncbi:hypothetical protein J43TS3_15650 [Ornithinibacillus bavariensis]|uniref:Uncharacterized protein n=1 Tax=Ornithinibacillus bavariensis TaxID=545502 RepID=A0A919X8G3_9BACI|nr:hypothetical protein J43TS3_15650 [Ornithinibacillus bavariensis]